MNQNTDKYSQKSHLLLNYSVINNIRKQLNICETYIDLLDCRNYVGRRFKDHGRIVIELKNLKDKYIIIDKNHTTRYYIEKIIALTYQGKEQKGRGIIAFQGYKFEPNKYLIHGTFELFQMKSFNEYIGLEEISLNTHKYQGLKAKNIYKRQQKGEVVFCKVGKDKGYYKSIFDRDLKQVMIFSQQERAVMQSNEYFSIDISNDTLQKLMKGQFINTKILKYFFDRLRFAYYSQFWYGTAKLKHIKVFQSTQIANFFKYSINKLNYSFFNQTFLYVYANMRSCVFGQQKLMIFPIYENQHFDLGAIFVSEDKIDLFQLDPLDSKTGIWRGKLGLLVNQNKSFLYEKGIKCEVEAQISIHNQLKTISAPKQQSSSDCGIYICLYALLLMENKGLLSLSQQLKMRCKGDTHTQELVKFIRMFLYYSYKQRNTYFLTAFQSKFPHAFNYYYNYCP